MQDKFINLLNSDECISEEMMLKYLGDTLSPADRHRIERHLIACDFCGDAMDGLSVRNLSETKSSFARLDERLKQRVIQPKGGTTRSQWFYRIAAVVVLVSLVGGGMYYLQSVKKSERVFTQNFEPFHKASPGTSGPDIEPPAATEALSQNNTMSLSAKKEKRGEKSENEVVDSKKEYPGKSVAEESDKSPEPNDSRTITVAETRHEKVPAAPVPTADQQSEILSSDESTGNINVPARQQPATTGIRENTNAVSATSKETNSIKKTATDLESVVVAGGSAASTGPGNLVPDGIKQYEAKNYSDAIMLFNTALANDRSNTEALFYNGLAHLSNNEHANAIQLLETVVNNSPNTFSDAAKWYLSLAYLKEHKVLRAKSILEELSGSKNEYQNKAKKALDELK